MKSTCNAIRLFFFYLIKNKCDTLLFTIFMVVLIFWLEVKLDWLEFGTKIEYLNRDIVYTDYMQ